MVSAESENSFAIIETVFHTIWLVMQRMTVETGAMKQIVEVCISFMKVIISLCPTFGSVWLPHLFSFFIYFHMKTIMVAAFAKKINICVGTRNAFLTVGNAMVKTTAVIVAMNYRKSVKVCWIQKFLFPLILDTQWNNVIMRLKLYSGSISYFHLDHVCEDHEYKCTNNKCIHKSFACNGEDDCGDNSDEGKSCKGNLTRELEEGGEILCIILDFSWKHIMNLICRCSMSSK